MAYLSLIALSLLHLMYVGDARAAGASDPNENVIELLGPTLIAFYPQVSVQQVEANPGLVDRLDSFYNHLNSVGKTLVASGVRVYARPLGEIRILDGDRVRILEPPPEGSDVGYYMVAPGLEARLLLGIHTDIEMMDAVNGRFTGDASSHEAMEHEISYTVKGGMLHVFGHALSPRFGIKLAESPQDDDASSISFPTSSDGHWVVIVHSRDVDRIEFWLYDARTGEQPLRIPVGPGRYGEVTWHDDEVFEISFAGPGYTLSQFVHVARPDQPFQVADLLHYDSIERVYVAFYHDGVEVGRLFEPGHPSRERFPIELDYESTVDAILAIEKVATEGSILIVTHRRRDGSIAREAIAPEILQH